MRNIEEDELSYDDIAKQADGIKKSAPTSDEYLDKCAYLALCPHCNYPIRFIEPRFARSRVKPWYWPWGYVKKTLLERPRLECTMNKHHDLNDLKKEMVWQYSVGLLEKKVRKEFSQIYKYNRKHEDVYNKSPVYDDDRTVYYRARDLSNRCRAILQDL